MATATPGSTQILDVVIERVKSTSEWGSIYSASTSTAPLRRLTVKQWCGPVREGQRWCVAGKEVDDQKWGRQFMAQFATLGVPQDEHELRLMLASELLDGWDYGSYYRLADHFGGNDLLQLVREHPYRLAEARGISESMVQSLQAAYQRAAGMAETYAQLAEWGISGRVADALVKHHGFSTLDNLRENPYRDLLEIPRYGWRSAESIRQQIGMLGSDPKRVTAGLEVGVHEGTWQAGNTSMTKHQAIVAACGLLGQDYGLVQTYVDDALSGGWLTEDGDRIYPSHLYQAEQTIAAQLAERLTRPGLITSDHASLLDKPETISDGQWDAVQAALTWPVSLLTGGPGVGKTTALRALVRCARDLGLQVTCMAPTGKAAARMAEATGVPASTIHSRLKIVPGVQSDPGDVEPVSGLVIVDEVSMLDTSLAAAMLSRLSPAAQILLVGDPDQLPSVGPGAVLRDLLDADVLPRVHLDKVYRNEAGIAINAARIRDGKTIAHLPDCQLIPASDPEQAKQRVVDLLAALASEGYAGADVLVLTPTNDGPSGRYELNHTLQPILNRQPAGSGIIQFCGNSKDPDGQLSKRSEELRQGDRVMVTKNSTALGVFNGQVGLITDVHQPRSIDVDIDGTQITFSGEDKRIITLAYAITGHKSQGSEAPIVISPIFGSRMLSREWLYTVLTRARERCYLIGDVQAMQGCLSVRRTQERRTGLVDRITLACGDDAGEEDEA